MSTAWVHGDFGRLLVGYNVLAPLLRKSWGHPSHLLCYPSTIWLV